MDDLTVGEPASVLWDEVAWAAESMFRVWVGGRELEWAKMAWDALTAAGLTTYRNEIERYRVLVRLMTLATMYREFCTLAWEEEDEPLYGDWISDLEIPAFRLGQLVGPEFAPDDQELEETELAYAAVASLIESSRRAVYRALVKHFGGASMLFASLYATNLDDFGEEEEYEDDDWGYDDEDEVEDDGTDDTSKDESSPGQTSPDTNPRERTLAELLADTDVLDDILNEVTYGKMEAFEWVSDGMPSIF